MKRNQEIFCATPATGLSLAAGRTLGCWRRDMTREASQLDTLRRACDWVEPLTEMSVTLRDEPLFGRCIAELVEAEVAKEGADRAAHQDRPNATAKPRFESRPRETRAVWDKANSAARPRAARTQPQATKTDRRRLRNRQEVGASVECSSGGDHSTDAKLKQAPQACLAEVARLPQRASRELLESCANAQPRNREPHRESQATECTPRPATGRSRAAAGMPVRDTPPRSSPSARPETERDEAAPGKSKADTRRPGARLDYHQSPVSMKKREAFTQASERGGTFEVTAESPAETFARRLARRTANTIRHLQPSSNGETQVDACLSEQWAITLEGTVVSDDLLRELVTGEMNTAVTNRRDGGPKPSSPPAKQHLHSARQPRVENSVVTANKTTDVSPSSRKRHETPSPGSVIGSREDSFGVEREYGEETANRGASEQIAPPSLAASLPALSPLPRQAATGTGVLPLASEIARHGAHEEAISSEDLDALADKIKFILDEQARRHGIDV